jgi:two-component system, LytTR family, response regulator
VKAEPDLTMGIIRTIVVDDEKPARMRLLELLSREADVEVVGTASNGREAVELIRGACPDLLFLDVQMPRLDGFGVLAQLAPDDLPVTIFVTAYDKYAIQAFDAHAIDYLLKPYSDQRFEKAVANARRHLGTPEILERAEDLAAAAEERRNVNERSGFLERLVMKTSGSVTLLDVRDVDWIEAAGVYVNLHVGVKIYLYRSSVNQLLQRLDPRQFVRVHRSAAVNAARIRELRPRSHGDFTVVLASGVEVTMSRGYRPQLEAWLRQPL